MIYCMDYMVWIPSSPCWDSKLWNTHLSLSWLRLLGCLLESTSAEFAWKQFGLAWLPVAINVWRNHRNQWQLYKPCRVSSELRHLTPPGFLLSGCDPRITVTAQYQAASPFTALDPNLSDPPSYPLSYSCLSSCPPPCLTPRFCHTHHIATPL